MNQQYDIIFIQQYLEGKLAADDMHKLERAALEDPLLQDAIDGFTHTKVLSHKQLSLLQQRLEDRIIVHQEEKNRFYFTGQRLAIASVAGVLMIVVAILFWMVTAQSGTNSGNKLSEREVFVEIQDEAKVDLVEGSLIPLKGWDDYQDYLSINGSDIVKGTEIRVSFSVKDDRPSNIKIISKGRVDQTETIINLLENGPLWKGGQGEIIIRF